MKATGNMLNAQSAVEMMRALSLATDASQLARVFAGFLRDTTCVNRGLVVRCVDPAHPHFRVELCADWDTSNRRMTESHPDTIRRGGLIGELLQAGQLRIIPRLAVSPHDSARDLLDGFQSLVAFPLFDAGRATGAMIMLCRHPWDIDSPTLCELAVMGGLMDRAICTQNLARELQESCMALDRELTAAAEVQRWLLPSNLPAVDGVSLAASYRTARRSGGDYYDALILPDGNLGMIIADVSGKGAPAAVLTAVVRTIVHSGPFVWRSPAALLQNLNAKLSDLELAQRGAFVTAFCAILDVTTGKLIYSSAGHPPPRMIRTESPTILEVDAGASLPLGIDAATRYFNSCALLMPADTLVMFTDGVIEATSAAEQLFGIGRLDGAIQEASRNRPNETVRRILRAVETFSGDTAQADDQTLLVLQFHPQMVKRKHGSGRSNEHPILSEDRT